MFIFQKSKSEPATSATIDPNVRYGVLKYSSQNIGDEVQSLAAMRFLPRVDYYCHRERLDQFHVKEEDAGKKVKLIMNAWWMWEPKHFPPSDDIDPLLISMHMYQEYLQKFDRPEVWDYLRAHGPVGCRDKMTMRFLLDHDVPAYFSGCLTMTLQGNPKYRKKHGKDYVLCVDVPEHIVKEIRTRTDRPVYDISRMLSVAFSAVDRIKLAKVMLALYHNAHCIVSPRFHVALPATAFGTPVCVIDVGANAPRRGRFEGMEQFFHDFTEKQFMENRTIYNFDTPPKNPNTHLKMREELIQKVSAFTGYDSQTSILEDDYEPLIDVIQLLKMNLDNDRSILRRALIFATKDELVEALYTKQIRKKSKHDLEY